MINIILFYIWLEIWLKFEKVIQTVAIILWYFEGTNTDFIDFWEEY